MLTLLLKQPGMLRRPPDLQTSASRRRTNPIPEIAKTTASNTVKNAERTQASADVEQKPNEMIPTQKIILIKPRI